MLANLDYSILGRILCWIGLHRWGRWHSYRRSDLESIGKPRAMRWCLRFDCETKQEGPICR